MVIIKYDEYILTPNDGIVRLYYTLRGTAFADYVPYNSISVSEDILTATIFYFKSSGFAGLTLERYLNLIRG